MGLVESIILKLKATPAVYSLIADRMHINALPQKPVVPAAVITVQATNSDHTQDGLSQYVEALVMFDVYARTHLVAKQVEDQIALALVGFTGSMPGDVIANGIFIEDETAGRDDGLDLEIVTLELLIQYLRP